MQSSCGVYEVVIPSAPDGTVAQVTSELGSGSAIFGLNTEELITVLGHGVGGKCRNLLFGLTDEVKVSGLVQPMLLVNRLSRCTMATMSQQTSFQAKIVNPSSFKLHSTKLFPFP